MRITYDDNVDAVFVYLVPSIGFGEAKYARICEARPEVTLSFDAGGKLLGIEILHASRVLSRQGVEWVRETAERLGPPGIYRPEDFAEGAPNKEGGTLGHDVNG